MTEIQPFIFPATGQTVRTVVVNGEPWFVAADVTDTLGYANGRDAVGRLVSAGQRGVSGIPTPFGEQSMTILSEAGVYRLVMRSNRPEAIAFQDWLAEQVIPSIRKTGSYTLCQPTELEVAERYVAALKAKAELESAIAELAPAAHAWNVLGTAADDYDVASAANILSRDPAIKIGRTRLFTYLANEGWIYRKHGAWAPYQTQIDNGRLMVLPQSHYHPRSGELVLDPPQIRITVKGLTELHKRLGGQSQLPALMSEELTAV